MKTLLFLLSLFTPVHAYSGQESHGGNGTTLEFVKIGQNIKRQMELHPEWKINQIVTPQKLSWSISNTFVSAGDSLITGIPRLSRLSTQAYTNSHKVVLGSDQLDAYDSVGDIYIHLALWNNLDCNKKIREVFHLYLTQFNYGTYSGERFDDSSYQISSLLLGDLVEGSALDKLCALSPDEPSKKTLALENLTPSEQIKILRGDIIKFLGNRPRGLAGEAVKAVAGRTFKAVLETETQVIPQPQNLSPWLMDKDVITTFEDFYHKSEEENLFIYSLPDQSLQTRRREIQLGSMMSFGPHNPAGISIWINEKRWATFTYSQKFELLFHESLSLFTTLDLYYRVSSTLFLE